MDWDRVPDDYLWYYFHDLAYVELQADLFPHLFPACLRYWYETLMRNEAPSLGDSDFHYSLMRGQILENMLSESERQSLYDFFRDGFLDRIEAERGFRLRAIARSVEPQRHVCECLDLSLQLSRNRRAGDSPEAAVHTS